MVAGYIPMQISTQKTMVKTDISENMELAIKDAQIEELKRLLKKAKEESYYWKDANVLNVTGTNKIQFNFGKMIERMCEELEVVDTDLKLIIDLTVLSVNKEEKMEERKSSMHIPISFYHNE